MTFVLTFFIIIRRRAIIECALVYILQKNLEGYVERVFHAIVYSGLNCPGIMCEVFNTLKEAAIKNYPCK